MHGELRHSLLPVERDGVGIGLRPADSHEPHPGLFRGGRVDRRNSCHGVIPAEAETSVSCITQTEVPAFAGMTRWVHD